MYHPSTATLKLPGRKLTTRSRLFYFMIILYSNHQLAQIKKYKCDLKAIYANKRFDDKIITHDVISLLEKYNFKCFYCNENLIHKTWQLDHFYSRAMKGKNVPENICPACKWCNQMKHALDGNAFILKCQKITSNNFFKRIELNTKEHG